MNNNHLLTLRDSVIMIFNDHSNFSLCVVHGLSRQDEDEMQSRGWLGYVYLFDSDSEKYWPLNFYDPVRLAQDTEMTGYTNDIGLIVIQEVTLKSIIDTCHSLLKDDYVKYHKPFTKKEIMTLYCLDQF